MEEINYDIMRYDLDDDGYVSSVYFGCSSGTCTGYTGEIPEGYETLEEWYEKNCECVKSWKIVDGNLVFDASRDYKLKIIYEQENNDNAHVTRKEMGMASTEEINPYVNLFPSHTSDNNEIVSLDDDIVRVGNFPADEVELNTWWQGINLTGLIELEFIGNNFLPNTAIESSNNGITYKIEKDKKISISGTSTAKSSINLAGTETSVKKILTFKRKDLQKILFPNNELKYLLSGLTDDVNLEFYYYDGTNRTLVGTYNKGLIYFDEDTPITQIVLTIESGITIDTTIAPMLSIVNVEYPILPMTKYKGNLFDYKLFGSESAVDYTYYKNSGLEGLFAIPIYVGINVTVTASSNVPVASSSDIYLINDLNASVYGGINVDNTRTITSNSEGYVYLAYATNRTYYNDLKNGTYWVMVNEGSTPKEYEAYNGRDGQYYVDGVSTQETRSGKNKFNYASASDVANTTVTQYRIFEINGLEPTTEYIFHNYEKIENNTDTYIYLWSEQNYSDANKVSISVPNSHLNSRSLVSNEEGKMYLAIYPTDTTTWENFITYFEKAQLEEGTTITEHETYGVSPSPDYPSEIINIYKAGTYNAVIDNKVFMLTIPEDLRGLPNGVGDRLWLDAVNNHSDIERKVGEDEVDISFITTLSNGNVVGIAFPTGKIGSSDTQNLICSKAINNRTYVDGTCYENPANVGFVGNSTDTLETLKAKYDGAILYYQLATYNTTDTIECGSLIHNYEEYKNNKTLIDLKGNEFTIYDIIQLRDNQIIFVKNGVKGTDIEEIYLDNITMPRTYEPITHVYSHQQIGLIITYKDPRNVDITKISLKGLLSITDIETEYNYTLEDVEKVIAYVNGETTLTDEELEYYDVNADGVVDKVDSAEMLRMYHGYISNIVNGTLEINSTKANRTIILRDSEGKIRTSIGLNGATTPNLSCENLTANNIKLNNEDLIDTLFFKHGDVYTVPRRHVGGFVTSSNQQISFTLSLPKRLDKITSIDVMGGKLHARVPNGGYIDNLTYDTPITYGDQTYTWTVYFFDENTVTIIVDKSSDYTNINNNSPLGIQVENLILQFYIDDEEVVEEIMEEVE